MTNLIDINEALGNAIEDSEVGEDNALSHYESRSLADEILSKFLVMHKADLPEVKVMDTMIYAGNQAVHINSKAEEVLEKALSFLAAAAKLKEIEAQKEEERQKEESEILSTINSLISSTSMKRTVYSGLTEAERLAAKEIIKLRNQLAKMPLAG